MSPLARVRSGGQDLEASSLCRFMLVTFGPHALGEARRHVVAYSADRELANIWMNVTKELGKLQDPPALPSC